MSNLGCRLWCLSAATSGYCVDGKLIIMQLFVCVYGVPALLRGTENFMFGLVGSPDEDKIFLIDFGLSVRSVALFLVQVFQRST